MYRGFIKLWRKVYDSPDHPINQGREFTEFEAWIDLIMLANYEDKEWQGTIIKRGELYMSLQTLASRWKWTKSRVRRFLSRHTLRHTLGTISDTLATRIKIINYDTYNPSRHASDTLGDTLQAHLATPTKRIVKEEKNYKEGGDTPTPSEIAKKFFTAWEKPELRGKQFEEFSKILGSCLDAFCEHWTEPTKSGTRQLWQTKPTFELSRRIKTWLRNEDKWKANGKFDWGKSFKPTKGGETPDGRKIICEVQGGYWKLEDGTFLAYHGTRWINVDGKGHAL